MLSPSSSSQTAIELSGSPGAADRVALRARAVVPWRWLLAAALLSLALGVALSEGLAGGRSSALPAVRAGASSQKGLLSLPLLAQGQISGALGADEPAYRVSASFGGFQAASPAQGLHARFGRSGVLVSSRTVQVGLSLRAVGYGTSLRTLGEVSPSVKGNRVTYAYPGLGEWYENGPLGVEQGFTIPRARAGHQAGLLTLAMALSGNAHATLSDNRQSLTLSRAGGSSLRYDGLRVSDARGRTLYSWLQLQNGQLLLRVDTRGARYPLRIDPFIQQGEKLTGEGLFGWSVALSADGSTALIGAPYESCGQGAAWVFTRSEGTWTQQGQKLTGGPGDCVSNFGWSVALSSDGNTALIGEPDRQGAALVFTRSGSTWTHQATLTGSEEQGESEFGYSVALSSDGNTALIGGPYDGYYSSGKGEERGAAWLFTRSGSTWTQRTEKLTCELGAPCKFGYSVALSGDGNTALIGAPERSLAWVFTRSGEKWTEQTQLRGESAALALSSDSNTALIGEPGAGPIKGAAWVFTRSGTSWTRQSELARPSGASGRYFGASVALSADGNTALIGEPEGNGLGGAAAWVFTRSAEQWTQREALVGGGESEQGLIHLPVALSSDSSTALFGGLGAAWVFAQSLTVTSVSPNAGPMSGGTKVTITGTNLSGATAVHFGMAEASEVEVKSTSEITAVSPPGTGTVDVTVTTPEGTSTTNPADEFTYETVPTVITGAASSLGQASATLNATVNPEGATVSDCHFEYGTSPSYGSSVPCSSLPGSGASPVPVSARATGLSANTTYYFRIVATNALGTSYGDEQTFQTLPNPPTVETGAALAVTQTTATLNATVNPNEGAVISCQFDYGTSPSYGSSVPCSSLPGSGSSPVEVSAGVSGLSANTTYHYRIVATSAGGTSYGGEATFTTLPNPPTLTKLEPDAGLAEGGTYVKIKGMYLAGATEVEFGGTAVPASCSETECATTSPAGAGMVSVTVTTAGGTSNAEQFTYVPAGPAPTVIALSVTSGPTTGGTSVTITGTDFTGVTALKFGPNEAVIKSSSETSITVESPAGTGTVYVTVTTPNGTSPGSGKAAKHAKFKYKKVKVKKVKE